MKKNIFLLFFLFPFFASSQVQVRELDKLGIKVSADENRDYSFTDKKFGYYYGATHAEPKENWFAGWNLNTKRIFKDYDLFVDDVRLNRKGASVTCYPNKLRRVYQQCIEEFYLFDDRPIIGISINDIKGDMISLKITGELDSALEAADEGVYFIPKESPDNLFLLTTLKKEIFEWNQERIIANKVAGGFVILFGKNRDEIRMSLVDFRRNFKEWINSRENRMIKLIYKNNHLVSRDEELSKAIKWLLLTTDQLIMNQMGWGIYAGLPWFNDYWGRDLFITFPGAALVTGQFETARNILTSFVKFQNEDINSKYYGRVPNRARPDEIIYNSTDGTPRLIIELENYIKYTGDTGIIRELYPNIKRAIDGALKYWVDEKGYLTHDDADTWMDAKEKGVRPFSPRGNRANDIQSLWYQQLVISARFAEYMNDRENQMKWLDVADRVKNNFQNDFFDQKYEYVADRISAEGVKDFKLRPNQLYAFELIDSKERKASVTRKVWSSLVYPWGVASLSQDDEDFHPYHENWHYYHKDAAYHNGTVWLWNNGMAMQRMIEHNEYEKAWKLFKNMNHQALHLGAIGSLSENADAIPRPGMKRGRLSGTFLQAWSNAEHLRIWYQYFLGLKPDMLNREIRISPRLPNEIKNLEYSIVAGKGSINALYDNNKNKYYEYKFNDIQTRIVFSLPAYDDIIVEIKEGWVLKVLESEKKINILVNNSQNVVESSFEVSVNPVKVTEMKKQKLYFKDTDFCKPKIRKGLKSLQTYHKEALTY